MPPYYQCDGNPDADMWLRHISPEGFLNGFPDEGSFGAIILARDRDYDKAFFAMKLIKKDTNSLENNVMECEILREHCQGDPDRPFFLSTCFASFHTPLSKLTLTLMCR